MNRAEDASLLAAAYREESDLYRKALALAQAAEGGDSEWPRRLNDLFRRIDAIENRIAAARKRWQEAHPYDPAVTAAASEVAGLIAQIQDLVNAATRRVEQRRQAMMPKVAAHVQADRVHQAYRRADRFGPPRDRRTG